MMDRVGRCDLNVAFLFNISNQTIELFPEFLVPIPAKSVQKFQNGASWYAILIGR